MIQQAYNGVCVCKWNSEKYTQTEFYKIYIMSLFILGTQL